MSVSGRWRQTVCGVVVAALVAGCSPSNPPAQEAEPLQYQPVDDICALDLSELFPPPSREPFGTSDNYGSETSLFCIIDFYDRSVEPGEGGSLTISVQVLPQYDPDAVVSYTAEELYTSGQELRREQEELPYRELAGLGSGAEWSTDGKDVTLAGYDGNLLFDLRWNHDTRTPLSPPDMLQRLVHVAGLILTELRAPGLPAPVVLPASSAPLITAEHLPPPKVSGGYRAVENLCEVVDVSSLGPATAPSHSNRYGSDEIEMTCSLEFRTVSRHAFVTITATVFDGLADSAYAAYLTVLPGQAPADQPFVRASGSRYTIANAGQSSFLVAHNLNLLISIAYTAVPAAGNVGDELAAVADSLLAALSNS